MAGHKLVDSREHRLRTGDVAERQILGERRLVEFRRQPGIRKNGLDLGPEKKSLAVPAIIEGLNAESVSRREQHALPSIPNRESEHASQMLHTITTVFFVKMNDGFGITVCTVAMSLCLQASAKVDVVVDLAVVDDPNVLTLVSQRLVAALDVDNAQAAHGQTDVLLHEEAFVVRAAVNDAAIHARQHVALYPPVAIGEKNAADSTHIRCVSFRSPGGRIR